MISTGVLTAVCFIVIAAKLGPDLLRKILGFEVYVDVGSHFFFIWLGALSGTFSGVMTGIISALLVSAVLRAAKNIIGYEKLEEGNWVSYPGKWTVAYLTEMAVKVAVKTSKLVASEVKVGLEAARKNNQEPAGLGVM